MGILNLFWKGNDEQETSTTSKNKTTDTKQKPNTVGPITTTVNFSTETTTVSGVKDEKIAAYFQKVFQENNIPGPDYQEFKMALDKMQNIAQDEATKVKTVFIGFEAMGLTAPKLIETAGVYKKLFADKLSQFDGELAEEFEKQVGDKQKQVEALNESNTKIDEQMKKLNDQKLANKQSQENLNSEIQKNTAELNKTKSDWHATYDDVIKEIDAHIALIQKHLM